MDITVGTPQYIQPNPIRDSERYNTLISFVGSFYHHGTYYIECFDSSQDGICVMIRSMTRNVEKKLKMSLRLNNGFNVFKIPPYYELVLLHTALMLTTKTALYQFFNKPSFTPIGLPHMKY